MLEVLGDAIMSFPPHRGVCRPPGPTGPAPPHRDAYNRSTVQRYAFFVFFWPGGVVRAHESASSPSLATSPLWWSISMCLRHVRSHHTCSLPPMSWVGEHLHTFFIHLHKTTGATAGNCLSPRLVSAPFIHSHQICNSCLRVESINPTRLRLNQSRQR